MARVVLQPQIELGEIDIADIQLDPRSRDDIPQILRGLQYIYMTTDVRDAVFNLLTEKILVDIDKNNGRQGMNLWSILVLGVLRLDLNCDYDRLQELANEHRTIREMLGHSDIFDKKRYALQTLKDNVRLLTPELLNEINGIVVNAGHGLLPKKKADAPLRGRCDSFVVETNVHYPTDINLLYDAMRKIITISSQLSEHHNLSNWRQHTYNRKQIKRAARAAQQKKKVNGKSAEQKEKAIAVIKQAHEALINLSITFIERAMATSSAIKGASVVNIADAALLNELHEFIAHAKRQIDQVQRRVLAGEAIPHAEKVFSLFEPHTEWICKGKAGVPVEFGLRVCILEDQHQFILHHQVMENKTDVDVAVPMTAETLKKFPTMSSCSYDKGFHSQNNQAELKNLLETVGLRAKGKRSKLTVAREATAEFKAACDKHSAVESAINALEVHGLDKCRDHGIIGFQRYVSLAVLARNIHRIGDILQKKELAKLKRQSKKHKANSS